MLIILYKLGLKQRPDANWSNKTRRDDLTESISSVVSKGLEWADMERPNTATNKSSEKTPPSVFSLTDAGCSECFVLSIAQTTLSAQALQTQGTVSTTSCLMVYFHFRFLTLTFLDFVQNGFYFLPWYSPSFENVLRKFFNYFFNHPTNALRGEF